MKLGKISLNNYKVYRGTCAISFEPVENRIIKNNEEGKSTLAEAIKDAIYGTVSSVATKGNWYTGQKPYIRLELVHGDATYEIEVDCNRSKPKMRKLPDGTPSDREQQLKNIIGKNYRDLINLLILEQEDYSTQINADIFEELSGIKIVDELVKEIDKNRGKQGEISKAKNSATREYHKLKEELDRKCKELQEKEKEDIVKSFL